MTNADENIKAVSLIRARLDMGEITYQEAKDWLEPILERMNKQAEAIAKKFGKKHKPFTASGLLR